MDCLVIYRENVKGDVASRAIRIRVTDIVKAKRRANRVCPLARNAGLQALKFNIEFPLEFASKTVNEKETPYTDRDRCVCDHITL